TRTMAPRAGTGCRARGCPSRSARPRTWTPSRPGSRRTGARSRRSRRTCRGGHGRSGCATRTASSGCCRSRKRPDYITASVSALSPSPRGSGMTAALRDFLEIPYDELEERNLAAKKQRIDRVPAAQIQEERLKYLTDEKRIKAVTVCFTDLE